MRKSYLMIAVAATMLVSCADTEKLNNELLNNEQLPIGFSSYSQKATRGDVTASTNLEFYHNTFAVYGTKQSTDDTSIIQYIFGGKADAAGAQDGVTCTYQATPDTELGDWKYDFPRFWDKQADYDFIAYTPVSDKNPIRYNYNAAGAQVGDDGNDFILTDDFILTGTNLQAAEPKEAEILKGFTGANGTDIDIMTSSDLIQENKRSAAISGATRSGDYVNLEFKHILAKLNVRVNKAESLYGYTVTVKSIEINGFKDKATAYSEKIFKNTATEKVSGWTADVEDANYALEYNAGLDASLEQVLNEGSYDANQVYTAGKPHYFIESLLIPQTIIDNQVSLKIRYRIEKGDYVDDRADNVDLYDITSLRNLLDRHNYTLNITINPDPIKFDAAVADWTDGGTYDKDVY